MILTKEPSPVEVYNDLDEDLCNFFRVLRDPQLIPRLLAPGLAQPLQPDGIQLLPRSPQ